tara:strand:+ start:41 stop:163 length:123 start_codon:yes stop_codon:yes gene_type:complete
VVVGHLGKEVLRLVALEVRAVTGLLGIVKHLAVEHLQKLG